MVLDPTLGETSTSQKSTAGKLTENSMYFTPDIGLSVLRNAYSPFLFALFFLGSLPSIYLHTTHKAVDMIGSLEEVVDRPLLRRGNGIRWLDTAWTTLIEYCKAQGVQFVPDTCVHVESGRVVTGSGTTLPASRVYVCTGHNTNLVPPFVRKYLSLYRGRIDRVRFSEPRFAMDQDDIFVRRNGVLIAPQPDGSFLIVSPRPLIDPGMTVLESWEGTRAVSPDLLPFYVQTLPGVWFCSGGSFRGTFTCFEAAQDLLDGHGKFHVRRFSQRLAILVLIVIVAIVTGLIGRRITSRRKLGESAM